MSYLTLKKEDFPGFKKAVISLWFRIPSKTVQDISEEYQAWLASSESGPRRRFLGIIPLMTFGPTKLVSRKFYFPFRITGTVTFQNKNWSDGPSGYPTCSGAGWVTSGSHTENTGTRYYSFTQGDGFQAGGDRELDGSFIGADCTSGGDPVLAVQIVMPQESKASYAGAWPNVLSESFSAPVVSVLGGTGACPGHPTNHIKPGYGLCWDKAYFSWTHTQNYESNADVIYGHVPETFSLLPSRFASNNYSAGNPEFRGAKLAPDQWHHVLISFDLTANVQTKGRLLHMVSDDPRPGIEGIAGRTDSTIRMWVALDDENLTGDRLSAYLPDGYSDQNGILSVNGFSMAQETTFAGTYTPDNTCKGVEVINLQNQQLPTYSFTPSNASMETLGLPAVADYSDAIRQVEMAELQIFTDIALDFGVKKNCRAFVDDDGKPVSQTKKKIPDDPESYSGSIELLGKRPEVLLHGSSNWKIGKNTGTIGAEINSEGEETIIPAGQFTPTAKIEPWKPDPSLEETTA